MTPSGLGPHPVCFPALSEKLQAWYRRVTNDLTAQYPPYLVQLEAVEGCVRRCGSCAIASIRHPGRDRGSVSELRLMTIETAVSTVRQMVALGWTDTRIEISGHGEPTSHLDLPGLVAAVREASPSVPISIITSGDGLISRPGPYYKILELFEAGATYIGITVHDDVKVDKIRSICSLLTRHSVVLRSFPESYDASTARRIRVPHRVLAFLDPPRVDVLPHVRARNMAGAAAERTRECRDDPCARPFRELAVRWDGRVALCQDDWRGVYKCGSVLTDGLAAVWEGETMMAARRHLMTGREDIQLCRGCSSRSHRPRHLPDPHHAMTIAPPDDTTRAAVERAQSGEPYTKPVVRPWEV